MWEQIRSNKRKSVVLVFVMALLLMALGFFVAEATHPGAGPIGLAVAMIVWAVMSVVAYFQGDSILLAVSGAKKIEKKDHPQLFNVVEEMQIAAGLSRTPDVYILNDMALNAFATGRGPDRASVAVTAGLLGRLNRDQLQGVIAHEVSHVVNRDVLFMTMIGVMAGAIVMMADVFRRSLWYGGGRYRSSRDRDSGQVQVVMMVIALVLAILAPVLAQVIYMAASRRREYLADANAVVLTRYPEGLASALEVLAQDTAELPAANRVTAPMYIKNPLQAASALFSTHPPIEERIHILRSMASGASLRDYQQAWQQVSGRAAGSVPAGTLAAAAAAAAPIRAAAAPADTGASRTQMRTAGDLVRRVNGFAFLDCACGLRLKVPPDFQEKTLDCPRCGAHLTIPG